MVSTGKKTGILMGCGAVTVVMGAVMVVFWPPLFMSQMRRMMILTNQSASFDLWRETPITMYLEFYIFNITNTEEILSGAPGVKLKVEETGPYVFSEVHTKRNLTWNDNGTVTFYNQRIWQYEPGMSVGSLSDEVISVNPVIATVAYIMRNQNIFLNVAVDAFLRLQHENIFLRANVSSWLFEGINDPVLNIAQHFPFLPIDIPYDKFGWFYERNGSLEYDGIFNMNTGAFDFDQLGNIEQWQYSNRTTYRDECGVVKGSTGELWRPEKGQEEVYVFASDICTYVILSKDKEMVVEGIEGVQYSANASVFDNGYNYPHTACYCAEVRDHNCVPAGALNVSACRYGAPAFVSLPHFLYADPYYPSKIDGMHPTEDLNFWLALEMFTGMPLAVQAHLQINLLVRHVSGITINNVLPDSDMLVPMLWFRQSLTITPEYAGLARQALRLRYWVPYALYALTVIGIVLLMAGVAILIRKLLRSPDTTPILSEAASSTTLDT